MWAYSIYGLNKSRYCADYEEGYIFYDLDNMSVDYEKDKLSKIPFENPCFRRKKVSIP